MATRTRQKTAARRLAERVKVYVGGKRPDPEMDCDRDLWDLANEVLAEECERLHRRSKARRQH